MKTIRTVADLTPDPHNANKGTKRGLDLLERSLERNGAGRSIVVDRNGVVIAGNKTLETAAEMGLGIVVVKTRGTDLVVVQREDLDMASEDPRARELALADNRTSEMSLDWDANVLLNHMPGVNVGGYFFDSELAPMLGQAEDDGLLARPDNQKRTTAAPEPTVEPDPGSSPAHDPADEDQSVTCPECGHSWEPA
jgi:hypothetical protein